MPIRANSGQNTLPYHKPGCQCKPCKGKAKAIFRGAGAGGSALDAETGQKLRQPWNEPEKGIDPKDIIHADGLPVVVAEDRSIRARVREIVFKRAQGFNLKEISEQMGLSYGTVRGYIYRASKEGWLKFESPYERFEQEILPKVVDNIDYYINKKDKQMTIEAAKGGGIFKSHQALRVEGDVPQTVLSLKIETVAPPSSNEPKLVEGHIIGTPKRLQSSNESE